MSGRSKNPHATRESLNRALKPRPLTESEKRERVDFYADNPNVHAVAVEPRDSARSRAEGAREGTRRNDFYRD
jgi:hypothetical protein